MGDIIKQMIATLFLISIIGPVAAQQRKSELLVGINWQPVASSAISDGSVAWFFDPSQNRVVACYSTKTTPEPRCHASNLPEPQATRRP